MFTIGVLGLMPAAGAAQPVAQTPPLLADSFPVGTSGSVCTAQGVPYGGGRASVFDRRWLIFCREVAKPVGEIWLTAQAPDPASEEVLRCPPVVAGQWRDCAGQTSGLAYRAYSGQAHGKRLGVRGLAAFDAALRLGLASVAENRVVPGEIAVAGSGRVSASTFFQAQAGAGDADMLVGQGYRSNNAGAFAEAAEIFTAVADEDGGAARAHELAINRALQLSNLGQFDEAARLFVAARGAIGGDPLQSRMGRNFEAMDALNRGDPRGALAILDHPMPPVSGVVAGEGGTVSIDAAVAQRLNTGTAPDLARILGQDTGLTLPERIELVEAQAQALRGTALRLSGKAEEGRNLLLAADRRVLAVRDGRVLSAIRLRSQILGEAAEADEQLGHAGDAGIRLRQAVAMLERQYPGSTSLNAARARLAGFLARQGRRQEASALFRQIVGTAIAGHAGLVGMNHLIEPWFDLLTGGDGATSPEALSDLFLASQLVERPGAADTLSALSRQLAGGSDAGAALFRRAQAVARDIERNRIDLADLAGAATEDRLAAVRRQALQENEARLEQAQLQLAGELAAFPQYRVVSRDTVTLADLRKLLHPGEAYLKLVNLGARSYALFVTPEGGYGWRLASDAAQLAGLVAQLRQSISVTVNNVRQTYPFDADAALSLGEVLLGPVKGDLAGVKHLVFEPDGAMLQLPLNLAILDSAGVDAYHARVKAGGDEYDFSGIAWLGRNIAVSTALSPASFRDARGAPGSKAGKLYLGLGQNQPLGAVAGLPATRAVASDPLQAGCDWPVAAWNNPIAATELHEAADLLGERRSDLMTGAAFTDTAIEHRADLADFRIVHFATHGLVTAPREGCPARPALLTSFGGADSDGLLAFDEIFNLHLDADLVILSACDTAGGATLEATRAAGVTSGGGQALDGLVRAFIAAGGREVIASHWPAPDDYRATERLFAGFFKGSAENSVADALRRSQVALMDDPQTSHPFYWAGFAIVGDGERPLHAQ